MTRENNNSAPAITIHVQEAGCIVLYATCFRLYFRIRTSATESQVLNIIGRHARCRSLTTNIIKVTPVLRLAQDRQNVACCAEAMRERATYKDFDISSDSAASAQALGATKCRERESR